jgi:hypothetical protein
MFLRKPCAAFDIGEEEGDSTGRERYIASNLNDLL